MKSILLKRTKLLFATLKFLFRGFGFKSHFFTTKKVLLCLFVLFFFLQEYEDRQLLWEQHEVELERKIAKLEAQQKDFYEAAKKVTIK